MNTTKKLRILFCDHLNLARGKYLPGAQDRGGEARFCQGVYALTYDKDLIPAPGSTLMEGLPDMVARFDGADIRPGWLDDRVVICDQYTCAGEPLPVSGRDSLKRAIGAWQALGYHPKVGVELEAYAFVRDDAGNWMPYQTPGACVYGTGPFTDPLGFTDIIWEQAERCGFRLEMITSEFDSPQFEFTLEYDDAMKAIDDVFLFRLMAREVAFRENVLLTFMPKPIEELSGSGVHVNFSLWDGSGNNAIGDDSSPDNLSELGRRCVAGLMHHHRSLSALLAPTVNSYSRLQPASLSGYWRNWGRDHRGVTTRISGEAGSHARIEHRMADGGANPYTMTAAILRASLLGHRNGYPLPLAETGDCMENQDAVDGVPDDLGSALDELAADRELVQAVGDELAGNLDAIKRSEIEKIAQMSDMQQIDYYIHFI